MVLREFHPAELQDAEIVGNSCQDWFISKCHLLASKVPALKTTITSRAIDDERRVNVTLFLAELSDPESHYSIFEDNHGTHILQITTLI